MKYLYLAIIIFFSSCGQEKHNSNKVEVTEVGSAIDSTESAVKSTPKLSDTTIKFLWRDDVYDKELKQTFNSIVINEEYCKTISDPEKAALGYVATFIGNDCNWDGAYKDDRSNLKCKILTALNLGYQCSEKHLGFLRKMFGNDSAVLAEIKAENCPTTPDGATIQETFNEITLTIKGSSIVVFFEANGVNMRAGDNWTWTVKDYFEVDNDGIKLIKKEESKPKHEKFEVGVK